MPDIPDPWDALVQNQQAALREYRRCETEREAAVVAMHEAAVARDSWNRLIIQYNVAIRALGGDPASNMTED